MMERTVDRVQGNGECPPPDAALYEYAVIRYVPRVDREEFINVGLLMLCKRRRWMRGTISINDKRLLAFDPHVNIGRLRKQLSLFERDDVPAADLPAEEKYRWLAASKSAVIQVSPSHPGLLVPSDSEPEDTFIRLLGDLVG